MSICDPISESSVSPHSTSYNLCSSCATEISQAYIENITVTPKNIFVEPFPFISMMHTIRRVLSTAETFDHEKPASPSLLNNFVSSEIKKINNKSFDKLLNSILSEISFQLTKFEMNKNAKISVEITKDIEIPEWEEFVISIKLPSVNNINYEEYFDLWREIGENVKERVALTEVQDKKILEKYGNPMIILEEPEQMKYL